MDVEYERENLWLHRVIEESSRSTPQVQENIVTILKSRNFDIEMENDRGETPLMLAVQQGNQAMIEQLVRIGANVNCEDINGNTPLMQAVFLNLENIVDLLLKNKASCSVECEIYGTPLHVAIINKSESIVDKLIAAGADVNFATVKYGTAIEIALTARKFSIAEKLLAYGASLSPNCVFSALLKCYKNHFPNLIYFIVEKGFDVNTQGLENWSLLHVAVTIPSVIVVDYLLRRNADVNSKNKAGETPLHFAARRSDYSIVRLLLDHNCDVNSRDMAGNTALHAALISFDAEMVRHLLNAGADININNNSAQSPLDLSELLSFPTKKVKSYMLCARKLELAKVRIKLTQNDGKFPKSFKTLSVFEAQCLQELDFIKAKKICGVSLHKIFSESYDPVFADISDMSAYVKSNILKWDFPVYGVFLKRKFKEGKERNILLDNLCSIFRRINVLNVKSIILPIEIIRKVFVFLEEYDLVNVKTALDIF